MVTPDECIAIVNVHGLLGARHGFNELLKIGDSHINFFLIMSMHNSPGVAPRIPTYPRCTFFDPTDTEALCP